MENPMIKKIILLTSVTTLLYATPTCNHEEEEITLAEPVGFFNKRSSQEKLYNSLKITNEDIESIQFIVNTLASHSAIGLLAWKGELQERGERVRHVHILRFIGTIFTDKKMAAQMRQIRKSSIKWSNFVGGLKKSLERESKANKLLTYVPGFCAVLNLDESRVFSCCEFHDWDALFNELL